MSREVPATSAVTLLDSDLSEMSKNERIKVESKGLFFVADPKNTHTFLDEVRDLDGDDNVRSLVEKPSQPISNLAVPGLYLYDNRVVEMTEGLRPSGRGELEITDLNQAYLDRGELVATRLGRGIAWLDSGTHESLLEASNFIATIEHRQGLKIACLEEIALRTGAISFGEFEGLVEGMARSSYRDYLERVVAEQA